MINFTRKILVIFGVLALLLFPIGFSFGSASASTPASSGNSPDVLSCPAGFYYAETGHSQNQYGKGTALFLYNQNARSASLSEQFTSTQTLNYSSAVTGSAELDVIVATIGGSDAVTVGETTSESTSAVATVNNVPPGEYGVIQLGDTYWNTAGTYYYESATCVESQKSSVTARFPENPNDTLVLVGVDSSETEPWPQTN